MNCDLLDWIRTELAASQPAALPMVESVLNQARQTWGGDTVYLRRYRPAGPDTRTVAQRHNVTLRTAQRWQRTERVGA